MRMMSVSWWASVLLAASTILAGTTSASFEGWHVDRIKGWNQKIISDRHIVMITDKEIGSSRVTASLDVVPGTKKAESYWTAERSFYGVKGRSRFQRSSEAVLARMKGWLSIGLDLSRGVIVGQFVVVTQHETYVMTCEGDDDTKIRVAFACLEALEAMHVK